MLACYFQAQATRLEAEGEFETDVRANHSSRVRVASLLSRAGDARQAETSDVVRSGTAAHT